MVSGNPTVGQVDLNPAYLIVNTEFTKGIMKPHELFPQSVSQVKVQTAWMAYHARLGGTRS